jgi:hypothetical protein
MDQKQNTAHKLPNIERAIAANIARSIMGYISSEDMTAFLEAEDAVNKATLHRRVVINAITNKLLRGKTLTTKTNQ